MGVIFTGDSVLPGSETSQEQQLEEGSASPSWDGPRFLTGFEIRQIQQRSWASRILGKATENQENSSQGLTDVWVRTSSVSPCRGGTKYGLYLPWFVSTVYPTPAKCPCQAPSCIRQARHTVNDE